MRSIVFAVTLVLALFVAVNASFADGPAFNSYSTALVAIQENTSSAKVDLSSIQKQMSSSVKKDDLKGQTKTAVSYIVGSVLVLVVALTWKG